jgi:ABC-2 type transport system permease protein
MGFMGPALIAVLRHHDRAAAIAGEEDRGGLEIALSAPVSRIRVFTERCAGLLIGITISMIAMGGALWIFSALLGTGLRVGAVASGAAALGLFGLFTEAVAIVVDAATGNTADARGLAALAAVASYLINALARHVRVALGRHQIRRHARHREGLHSRSGPDHLPVAESRCGSGPG